MAKWTLATVATAVAESPARAGQAKKLAACFRAVSAAIAAGTVSSRNGALLRLKAAIEEQLGEEATPWGEFFRLLLAEFRRRETEFPQVSDLGEAMTEIAAGLDAVK
jgi:hypothetical protein